MAGQTVTFGADEAQPVGTKMTFGGDEAIKPPPASASTAAAKPSAGYWEDRGMAGKVWHPADRRNSSDVGRIDNSVGGLPPEMAAIAGAKVLGAAAEPALSLGGKALAGAKSIASQAAPGLKYEVTKSGLQAIGVPQPIAVAAAMAVAGYKKGASAPVAAAEMALPEGVERYAPNVSGLPPSSVALTAEQRAAQAASGYATAPAPSAPVPVSGPQGVPAAALGPEASARAATINAVRSDPAKDVAVVKTLIANGVPPAAAVKQVAGESPTRFGSLMTLYLRSRQVK